MKSIKYKLSVSLLLIAFVTVFSLESILYFVLHEYYFSSIETILSKQGESAAAFFENYLASEELNLSAKKLFKFSNTSSTAIQIIDTRHQLIEGNLGYIGEVIEETPDIKIALAGAAGAWKGNSANRREDIMAVAYPLQRDKEVVGVIRVMTSVETVNKLLFNIALVLSGVGLAVMTIVFMISLSISKTITRPLSHMVQFAEKMAGGDFSIRISEEGLKETSILTNALNGMATELSKLEELKNAFIAAVSHELRTPLTSIKGWAVTLHNSRSIDEANRNLGLKIIEDECDRLTIMVEQLLDFSGYITGQRQLNISAVNLNHLLEDIMKQFKPRFIEAKLNINLQTKDGLPSIKADEQKLRQVMINLIDNAIKFTPAGGSIRLGLEKKGPRVMITAEDSGCGIAKEELPKITERFYKGKSKSSGSGLGLAICKEIIKMHHGELKIESAPEKGTKISVLLPL